VYIDARRVDTIAIRVRSTRVLPVLDEQRDGELRERGNMVPVCVKRDAMRRGDHVCDVGCVLSSKNTSDADTHFGVLKIVLMAIEADIPGIVEEVLKLQRAQIAQRERVRPVCLHVPKVSVELVDSRVRTGFSSDDAGELIIDNRWRFLIRVAR